MQFELDARASRERSKQFKGREQFKGSEQFNPPDRAPPICRSSW